MLKILYYSLFFSGIIVFSQPSFALAKLGHNIVCQLAFEHLPLSKQQRISQLLQTVPKIHKTVINHYNGLPKNTVLTFANACTWADAIKQNQKNRTTFSSYKSWHYLNIPRNLTQVTKESCKKNCLPQAIISHQQQLQDAKVSWQSAQKLFFLGHWLGDIHQPLHVSYASDLGGNKIALVKRKSRCNNLHWYWDTCLIESAKRSQKQWIAYLKAQWPKRYTPPYRVEQVWLWADESYQLIRAPRFQYCQLTKQQVCLKPQGKVKLTSDYVEYYLPVMEQQLLNASQRLTRVLEQSL